MDTLKVRVWPIFLRDGSLVAIDAPPLKDHLRVSAVYDLLMERLAILEVNPIALELITESDEETFFLNLQPWYDLLLRELGSKLKADDMDWRSRYGFFLAGARVDWRGHLIPDLPGVSKLLGYARSESPGTPPKNTTGEPALDAIVAVALCFKKQWKAFMELPLIDAVSATSLAGTIYAEQQAEMDKKYSTDNKGSGGVKPQLRQPTLEDGSKDEPVISKEIAEDLRSSGLMLPDGL